MVCCVLVAISVFGVSSALVSLLGTNHSHTRPARSDSATLVLEDFRRLPHHGGAATQPSHEHFQTLWQRHHHAATDSSVQSLDSVAENESLAGDGTASSLAAIVLIACAVEGLAVPGPSGSMTWALSGAQLLPGRDPAPLERPPKA